MIMISRLIVGALLLVLGRRLYWLFVAGVGFLAGLDSEGARRPRGDSPCSADRRAQECFDVGRVVDKHGAREVFSFRYDGIY
jgi:hypothetical protein